MRNLEEPFSCLLWKSSNKARLCVETEAGNAFVSLHVGLGQACPPQAHPGAGNHRGGGPARQRRREKRANARQEAAMAEQATQATEIDASEEVTGAEQAKSEDNEAQENKCDNTTIVTETEECSIARSVQDEICGDEAFEGKASDLDATIVSDNLNDVELLPVNLKEGFVKREEGEILIEVRPQYCKFDEKELASKLVKHVGLELLFLPWIANTGPHFYTAGCKITEKSYEKFKVKGGGSLPKGFYTVETSRKMN